MHLCLMISFAVYRNYKEVIYCIGYSYSLVMTMLMYDFSSDYDIYRQIINATQSCSNNKILHQQNHWQSFLAFHCL